MPRKDLIHANLDVSDVRASEPTPEGNASRELRFTKVWRRLKDITGIIFESLNYSMLEEVIALELVPVKRGSGGFDQGRKSPNHGTETAQIHRSCDWLTSSRRGRSYIRDVALAKSSITYRRNLKTNRSTFFCDASSNRKEWNRSFLFHCHQERTVCRSHQG